MATVWVLFSCCCRAQVSESGDCRDMLNLNAAMMLANVMANVTAGAAAAKGAKGGGGGAAGGR